jgi:hypothetical protein
MIYLEYINGLLIYKNNSYSIERLEKIDAEMVDVDSCNSAGNRFDTTLISNYVTINDIIQTSADMIIETLSNG